MAEPITPQWYLVTLPIMYWNLEPTLAIQLAYVVNLGLICGNMVKDMLALPRPASPPVWRPEYMVKMDSTSMQDYGFPSTHTMNAITNPGYVFLYCQTLGYLTGPSGIAGLSRSFIAAAAWTCWTVSMILSR